MGSAPTTSEAPVAAASASHNEAVAPMPADRLVDPYVLDVKQEGRSAIVTFFSPAEREHDIHRNSQAAQRHSFVWKS